jgi:hypothetical protein
VVLKVIMDESHEMESVPFMGGGEHRTCGMLESSGSEGFHTWDVESEVM